MLDANKDLRCVMSWNFKGSSMNYSLRYSDALVRLFSKRQGSLMDRHNNSMITNWKKCMVEKISSHTSPGPPTFSTYSTSFRYLTDLLYLHISLKDEFIPSQILRCECDKYRACHSCNIW